MRRNAGGRNARPPPQRLLEKNKITLVSCDGNETESLQDLAGPETKTVKSVSLALSSVAVVGTIVYPNPKVFVAGTAVGKQLCVERGNLT